MARPLMVSAPSVAIIPSLNWREQAITLVTVWLRVMENFNNYYAASPFRYFLEVIRSLVALKISMSSLTGGECD